MDLLKMYSLLKMGIVQPAMLVYWNLSPPAFLVDRKMDHQRGSFNRSHGSLLRVVPLQGHHSCTARRRWVPCVLQQGPRKSRTWRLGDILQNCRFLFWGGGGVFPKILGGRRLIFVWFRFVSKFRFVWILGCEILRKNGQLNKGNFQNLQLISPRICHPVVGSGCTW